METFLISARDRITKQRTSFGFFTPQAYAERVCQRLAAQQASWYDEFLVSVQPIHVAGEVRIETGTPGHGGRHPTIRILADTAAA